MKKIFYATPFLLYMLFFISCKHDCSNYELTNEEDAFLFYTVGDMATFKNDYTGVYDTLRVDNRGYSLSHTESPCDNITGGVQAEFSFIHIGWCHIFISHDQSPYIDYGRYGSYYRFNLSGPTQTITINNTTYNDVFSVQIDSNIISNIDYNRVPWKIDYSKSKGFIRFHMKNGDTWSKL